MILYSIRRLSDGKFFRGTYYNGKTQWSNSPAYWRTAEAVWINLGRLCSEFYMKSTKHRGTAIDWPWVRKDWKNFDASKLKGYEVIETRVKVLGQRRIPAHKFTIPKELAKMNLEIPR